MEDDLQRGWTPAGARAYDEIAVYEEFFETTGEPVSVFVFVLASDDGSMQRTAQLNESINIIDFISNNITIPDKNGHNYRLRSSVRDFAILMNLYDIST